MPRYVTPSKVALLVLIRLYCHQSVPNHATIPILSFIISRLSTQPTPGLEEQGSGSPSPLALSILEFEAATAKHDSKVPGRSLWDILVRELWAINSLHTLHEFFDNLCFLFAGASTTVDQDENSQAVAPIFLSRTSPLGIFVRRAQLEFTRLQFYDSMKLWTAFIHFKGPTAAVWQRKNPNVTGSSFDENLVHLGLTANDSLHQAAYPDLDGTNDLSSFVSTDDIEKLLEFQLVKMQKLGNRVSDDLRERFRDMVKSSSTIPSLSHFVNFLDSWRSGDFTSALDNLHRYFDYSMQSRDKLYYQSALLHMAILQADFGCFSEAIAAINETIATARENQDMSCLNFSLGWLNHLSKAYPTQMQGTGYLGMLGSERDGLAFLKEKARETKMYNLLTSTLLSEAMLELSKGESFPRAIEHVSQASHLIVRENLYSSMGAQLLIQSAIYARLGYSHLADVYCELLLNTYNTNTPLDERLRAACRNAYTACQIGDYEGSLRRLEDLQPETRRTLKLQQYLFSFMGLLGLKRALREGNQFASQQMLVQLHALPNPDLEIKQHISLLSIESLLQYGSFEDAFIAVEDLGEDLKEDEADIHRRVRNLGLKASLYAKCGKPEKGFSIALRAASTAHRARLMPALWDSIRALAHCLIAVGEFDAARKILAAIIPQALEGGDLGICARLYSAQADAYMGLVKTGDSYMKETLTGIKKAGIYVDRALTYYERIKDKQRQCEMLMKKSVIARLGGDDHQGDQWAERYMVAVKAS